jgi:hypothetical protein
MNEDYALQAEASGNSSAVDEEESKKQQNVPMGYVCSHANVDVSDQLHYLIGRAEEHHQQTMTHRCGCTRIS